MILAEAWRLWVPIVVLTLLSGMGDAYGFTHAALVWQNGRLVWGELGRSAAGFVVGISLYWVVLRFMGAAGIVAPEVQTIAWFGVTLIGVGVLSGKFLAWGRLEQVVAVAVLAGIAWLLVRTGG